MLTTQVKPAAYTFEQCQQILDYVATYLDACIWYLASDMILLIDSDAAYLIIPQAKSRITGYYHLSNHLEKIPYPTISGAILVECRALKHIVTSSTEVETTSVFYNAQIVLPIHYIL